jgi:hypothetical protein
MRGYISVSYEHRVRIVLLLKNISDYDYDYGITFVASTEKCSYRAIYVYFIGLHWIIFTLNMTG